jgi:predicted nucleic acid-binding protein
MNYVYHDSLVFRSFDLAQEYRQPTIYDTPYLAVAEIYGCDFWTADEALFHAVADKLSYVHLLAHYGSQVANA